MSGKGAARAGKGFILFISNEDINYNIKIIKSLKGSNVSIDDITETEKYEIKKMRKRTSSRFVSNFGRSISATSDYFSSERY